MAAAGPHPIRSLALCNNDVPVSWEAAEANDGSRDGARTTIVPHQIASTQGWKHTSRFTVLQNEVHSELWCFLKIAKHFRNNVFHPSNFKVSAPVFSDVCSSHTVSLREAAVLDHLDGNAVLANTRSCRVDAPVSVQQRHNTSQHTNKYDTQPTKQ